MTGRNIGSQDPRSLKGRRALITGAQQGIGRATALALANAGADVAVNWLDDEAAAKDLRDEITGAGGCAVLVQADVSRTIEIQAMVDDAHNQLGGLDILINNAGIFPRSEFLELVEDEWDQVFAVNLKAPFLAAQAAARRMVADGIQGAIVNVSSSSVRGHHLGVHYSATKTGIIGLTRSMALALSPHGIRVNAIAPGLTDTAQPRYQFSEDELTVAGSDIPLGGRIADPSAIADVIVFLAGDAARFMTGELVHANGGIYMG